MLPGNEGHAEIERVWPREGLIRVEGRWHGIEPAPGGTWRALATLRQERSTVLRYPATTGPAGFAFSIPVEDLVTPFLHTGPSGPEQVWDLHLVRTADRLRLRLGRHLDDIPHKKDIFIYPAQRPAGAGDLIVRPFFTPRNKLSIRCRRPPAAGRTT